MSTERCVVLALNREAFFAPSFNERTGIKHSPAELRTTAFYFWLWLTMLACVAYVRRTSVHKKPPKQHFQTIWGLGARALIQKTLGDVRESEWGKKSQRFSLGRKEATFLYVVKERSFGIWFVGSFWRCNAIYCFTAIKHILCTHIKVPRISYMYSR